MINAVQKLICEISKKLYKPQNIEAVLQSQAGIRKRKKFCEVYQINLRDKSKHINTNKHQKNVSG